MTQIKCTGLALGYEGRAVTEDLSFRVSKGDYLCIVGENGSGKSTLAKALLRLIKPLRGTIEYANGIPPKIGYLPQQTDIQQDFPASVREVVMSGLASGKRGLFLSKAEKKTALDAMKRFGIEELSGKSFKELSGGQQQRVFLVRALCGANDILLLDEPVTGLDPNVTAEFYSILKELNQKDNMTVIMVSHDIDGALKYATHILHIGERQRFFGTCSEYLQSDAGKAFGRKGVTEND